MNVLRSGSIKMIQHVFRPTDSTAGFEEMLLLMAIHFHIDELKWIDDYMCHTLGMKINTNRVKMDKIKNIFTQLVFPKEVYYFQLIFFYNYSLLIFNIRLLLQELLTYQLPLI